MSGSIFDMLTDPTTSALMGLTQGFGQAALPTRMPTPIGAVLGQGVGGLQQGLATGQALKKGGLANQFLQNQYDMMQAMTKGGGSGAPMGAPLYGGGAGSAMTQQGSIIDPTYAAQMARIMAMNPDTAKAAGPWLDMYKGFMPAGGGTMLTSAGVAPVPGALASRQAAAAVEAAGTGLGGQPYKPPQEYTIQVPDSQGRTPGSPGYEPTLQKTYMTAPQANAGTTGFGAGTDVPRGIRNNNPLNLEYHEGQAGVVGSDGRFGVFPNLETGVAANTQQLLRYGQQGVNTLGAIAARWAPAPENDPQKYAQRVSMLTGIPINKPLDMSNPQVMARLVAGMGQVENGQMIDPGAITRGIGLAFGGGPHVAQAVPPVIQMAGPGAPTGGLPAAQQSPATIGGPQAVPPPPGMAGAPALTPQQQAQLDVQTANQKAMGEAQASRTRLITTRAGVYDPVSNQEVYRQPEYHETIDPNSGTEYPTFVQPGENGRINIMGGPPSLNGQVPPTKLGPGSTDLQKHLADNFANEGKQKYDGAMQSLLQLDQQDQNIRQLNQSGWSSTGSLNNLRMGLAKDANSILTPMGLSPIIPPEQVASWEDAAKVQKQLAFAQARQMGSREAASVVNMSLSATPGSENTPQGYQAISSGFHEMNIREGDLYNFQNQWAQTHNGNLIGAEAAFNKRYSPEMYGDRAISTIKPFPVKADSLEEFNKATERFLPGTRVLVNGQAIKIVPARPDGPVPAYIQNNFMRPANGG